VATGPPAQRALLHARTKQAMGDDALSEGDPDLDLHDYSNAFKDASLALSLASR
jgi:hypothetical protein